MAFYAMNSSTVKHTQTLAMMLKFVCFCVFAFQCCHVQEKIKTCDEQIETLVVCVRVCVCVYRRTYEISSKTNIRIHEKFSIRSMAMRQWQVKHNARGSCSFPALVTLFTSLCCALSSFVLSAQRLKCTLLGIKLKYLLFPNARLHIST